MANREKNAVNAGAFALISLFTLVGGGGKKNLSIHRLVD